MYLTPKTLTKKLKQILVLLKCVYDNRKSDLLFKLNYITSIHTHAH